ncbi:GNAT family N-acetyltransferase [Streptomyces sp. NPDC058678]|uniref:GNAT family N-acetyltransferase n=1 Tax=Streptomyces sp. NPDC058678 TaxID=3346595 RepID=UPI0036556C6F
MAASHGPAVSRWNLLPALSYDEARVRVERMHERRAAGTAGVWAIARVDGGEVVGPAAWIGTDLDRGNAETAYWVLPAGRGGGIAAEAARRLSRWALDNVGLHRLTPCHSVADPASCRVAAKAGFALEGTMRGALLHTDGWHDQHLPRVRAGARRVNPSGRGRRRPRKSGCRHPPPAPTVIR